ncbi:hypothetical protein Tco_0704714 [Tanacetum coccineum]|uniref:Uncharacterized protein n=1 Tax=Tanacetum coccineum TaxID=301880 RepID=A0ABQ4Y451_9ASTR
MLIFLNMILHSLNLLINPFPPADRSDFYLHEEFADELAHIISPPEMSQIFEASRAIVINSPRASNPQLHLGIRYPNHID